LDAHFYAPFLGGQIVENLDKKEVISGLKSFQLDSRNRLM